jgi:hypothetical protein
MPTITERIDAILAVGKRPAITLWPGYEIITPKGRRGRPRVRDTALPYKHYADPRSNNRRARCLGCGRRLRRNQWAACSPHCADQAVNDALYHLRLLRVTRGELMALYRFDGPPVEH